MVDYRDYGYLSGGTSNDIEVDGIKYGQVYKATHTGEGLRLPLMNRSFISFSYGGKQIEDFNLIATTADRLDRDGFASFNDNTTSYDNLDGEQYWGTHYKNHTFNFTLSTDGIDQKMLDEFLYWFHAGETRELILAEHPNRAILARVAQAPRLQLLPFEEQIVLTISGRKYPTKTTLYKGDITLELVSDQPFWYAKQNVLGIKDGERYLDQWEDANGNRVNLFASEDALKILYEDGIPLGSIIDDSMLLGNGAYANVQNDIISIIWSVSELSDDFIDGLGEGAKIDDGSNTLGIIAGAIVDASGDGINSLPSILEDETHVGYFFYAGNAPAFTEISFTLTPVLDNNGYIIVPRNSHSPVTGDLSAKYNTLTIESRTKQQLVFTTPNVYTSYNKAIDILRTYITTKYSWEDVRGIARDQVYHAKAREWLIKVLDYGESQATWNNNGTITAQASASTLVTYMTYFVCSTGNNPEPLPVKFTFNSENGNAVGIFQYRKTNNILPQDDAAWRIYGTNNNIIDKTEEDVGDMLRSNYIIIRDRNYLTPGGRIIGWQGVNDSTKSYSHRIYHDVSTPLTKLSVLYKNMYL